MRAKGEPDRKLRLSVIVAGLLRALPGLDDLRDLVAADVRQVGIGVEPGKLALDTLVADRLHPLGLIQAADREVDPLRMLAVQRPPDQPRAAGAAEAALGEGRGLVP